jgi:2-dehydropantoate 2-reductase
MNVMVVGAGAMGSLFGGLLQKAGNRVLLVDVWKEHVDAVQRNGLRIECEQERHTVPVRACTPPEVREPAQLIIVFTKSFHTEGALAAVRQSIVESTVVMTLQNGIGHVEVIEKFVPTTHIIHGITTYPCDIKSPGLVRTRKQGAIKMMTADGKRRPELDAVQKMFVGAGFNCEIVPEVQTVIWEKLAFNCAMNAMAAILKLPVGKLGDTPDGRALAVEIVNEVVAVAHKQHILIDQQRIVATLDMAFEAHRNHQPSMLQDILAGRPTEIDAINGAVVRAAAAFGLAVPVNTTLYRLVKIIAAARDDVAAAA